MKSMKRRTKRTTALVFALIALLLMAGLAIAASRSGILTVLFDGRQPSKETESLVNPAGQTVEADGVRLTVVDYLIDGDRVLVSYEIASTREGTVLCTLAHASESVPDSTTKDWDYMVKALGGTADGHVLESVRSDMIDVHQSEAMPTRPSDVTLVLRTGLPQRTLRIYPEWDPAEDDWSGNFPTVDDETEMRRFQQNGELPVYRGGDMDFPKWFVDVNSEKGTMRLLSEAGYVEPLNELSVSITIDPTKSNIQPRLYLPEPMSFEHDAYTLEVTAVEITATQLQINAYILPKQTREESGLSIEAYIEQFDFVNEYGSPIAEVYTSLSASPALMTTLIDWTENYDEWMKDPENWHGPPEDFKPYYETGFHVGDYTYGGVSILPDTLVLAPLLRGEDRRVAGYDMEKAMYLPLTRID